MRRGDFVWLIGIQAALGWPRFGQAQQSSKVYRLAVVASAGRASDFTETVHPNFRTFLTELRRLGYIEGQNLSIERYSAEGHPDRYHDLIGEVVRSNPDAVYIYTHSLAREFKVQTTTIPIVAVVLDPVGTGLVQSIVRPGGNITGAYAANEVWGKRLGLLKEAVPRLSRVGLLLAPTLVAQYGAATLKEASEKLNISLVGPPIDSPFDETAYRRAFALLVQEGAEAVYVGDQLESWINLPVIIELAQKNRLPTIYPMPEAIEAGGFMAYAIDYPDMWRHAADTIDQIFKGTKPGDIPFYQAVKFDFLINLKTAKTLGLEISPNLLAQADMVIE